MKTSRNPLSRFTDRRGTTLIEVLIAMTIFAVGLLGIGQLVDATQRNNLTGHALTRATMLAQEKIESLKLLSIDGMKDLCPVDGDPENIDALFERTCSVDESYSSSVNIIEVTVSWKRKGQTRDVTLKTMTFGGGT
jgi:prepilin-type N-terminal cleavage/methylation domain-containing protein